MSNEMVPVQAGQTARQDFGGAELSVRTDTAAVAVAAQAKAAVESRYIMAMKNPREWEDVRLRLEKECKRPGSAQSFWYKKPIGAGVEGLSIRFAEAALRCMRNVYPETTVIYESETQRIVQVAITDLEANLTYSSQVIIDKTVERSKVKDGQEVLGERLNSRGATVYLVRATEDELLNKQNALISKAMRTNALRLLPGDIADRCESLILQTRSDECAVDPDAKKREMIDAFDRFGIGPDDLAAYLGHSLERIQPHEIRDLFDVIVAIKAKEVTWDEVMESREKTGSAEQQQELRDKMAQRRGFANAAAAEEATKKPAATPAAAPAVPVTVQPAADKTPADGEPRWEVDEKQPETTPEHKGQGSMSFQRRNK